MDRFANSSGHEARLVSRLLTLTTDATMETSSTRSPYRVEVSGWDANRCFFVEKATLDLDAHGDVVVPLRQVLQAGLLVYLRMTDPRFGHPTFPVPYRVLQATSLPGSEASRITLRRLRRRPLA